MFSDNQLGVIQILGKAAEYDDLLNLLKQEYGNPSHSSENVVYYQSLGISVRTQPHNITFVSERLVREYSRFVNGIK
jgi:hypothetical protein